MASVRFSDLRAALACARFSWCRLHGTADPKAHRLHCGFALPPIPTGFGMLTMNTSANALVQTRTRPDKRGRAAGPVLVFLGATLIGSPLIGWVGTTFGARWSILGWRHRLRASRAYLRSVGDDPLEGARRAPPPSWVSIEADSSADAPRRRPALIGARRGA